MLIFLFFILIAISFIYFYKLTDKISAQRKQILLLKYENTKLKNKLKQMN
ncbi:cell division protein FtsB [Clostridium algifaecis]|uniref:Cell division protein FtsB n=1 Tax=Clostridium algifaecis TaxID=1472040 RepID=A0ABS4KWC7_9CLOT|nr:cell division protein FtsB [Clostridium algifaecis]